MALKQLFAPVSGSDYYAEKGQDHPKNLVRLHPVTRLSIISHICRQCLSIPEQFTPSVRWLETAIPV